MTPRAVAADAWAERGRRAGELMERWPWASEVLTFYRVLLEVQSRAWSAARQAPPEPSRLAAYVVERILPAVRDVSVARGPTRLADAMRSTAANRAENESMIRSWLAGDELPAVSRYVARAAAGPVLEALGSAAAEACSGPRDLRHCPVCGGLPQLSWFGSSAEDLVTPHRYLMCSRCAASWAYPRMTCAACGETDTADLAIFGEEGTTEAELAGHAVRGAGTARRGTPAMSAHFPHMRIDACHTCSRYVLSIDLGRDARAVPPVDELAAIPLDLYAQERGMTKVVPNAMGG